METLFLIGVIVVLVVIGTKTFGKSKTSKTPPTWGGGGTGESGGSSNNDSPLI
jgi:hypothetical protein